MSDGAASERGASPAGPDPRAFRALFAHFPTGVAVITGTSERGPVGMTANAMCSLSLEPLLVLVCFDNRARTLPVVREQGRFGVNMLGANQGELSRLFASKLPEQEKFSGVPHRTEDGVPIVDGVLGWLTCELRDLHPGGDHTIGVGAVRTLSEAPVTGDPLVWYRGDYRGIV
jgi:3-hydroxy-9,10-secoandrosta-1,3,5(10)-triene-9,17-dione monooxygenase reductase component